MQHISLLHSSRKKERKKFDVRESILGHLQQGGSPSAYDRSMAALLMEYTMNLIEKGKDDLSSVKSGAVGVKDGHINFVPMEDLPSLMHPHYRRPLEQWWMCLIKVSRDLATGNIDNNNSNSTKKAPPQMLRQWTVHRFEGNSSGAKLIY